MNKSSKSYGLHLKWDLEGEKVLVSGDTKVVRMWDIKTELRKGDWPTGFDSPVTSIDCHRCGMFIKHCFFLLNPISCRVGINETFF